jgi:hypothetical protein
VTTFPLGLLLAAFALAMIAAGQVWLVQLSSYRLWAFVGRGEWRAYHEAWWRSIWFVVIAPAVILFLLSILMLEWSPAGVPAWTVWLGFALQVALVAGTALWWAPLMANLLSEDGSLPAKRYQLLLNTHWLRVAVVSAYALLSLYMVEMSFRASS